MDAVIKDAWPRLATTTLTDQVYTVLRDRILAGQVCPGEFIREQEVSDAAGVSRTPVREALGRLASEGFLERIAHRGFRVPEESINDLLELYPILGTLEALAGRGSFPRLDEADIVELHEINRDYAAAAEREDHRAGIDLNDRFHHMLSRRAENGHLESMLDDLRAMVRRLEMWTFSSHRHDWAQSISDHNEILAAIEAGDFDTAVETVWSNRLMTYRKFRSVMAATPD